MHTQDAAPCTLGPYCPASTEYTCTLVTALSILDAVQCLLNIHKDNKAKTYHFIVFIKTRRKYLQIIYLIQDLYPEYTQKSPNTKKKPTFLMGKILPEALRERRSTDRKRLASLVVGLTR